MEVKPILMRHLFRSPLGEYYGEVIGRNRDGVILKRTTPSNVLSNFLIVPWTALESKEQMELFIMLKLESIGLVLAKEFASTLPEIQSLEGENDFRPL